MMESASEVEADLNRQVDNAVAAVGAAIASDNSGNYSEAFELYERAIRMFLDVMPRLPKAHQDTIQTSLTGYLDRAEQLSRYRAGVRGGGAAPTPTGPVPPKPAAGSMTPRVATTPRGAGSTPTPRAAGSPSPRAADPTTPRPFVPLAPRTSGGTRMNGVSAPRGRGGKTRGKPAAGRGARGPGAARGGARARAGARGGRGAKRSAAGAGGGRRGAPSGPDLTPLEQEILDDQGDGGDTGVSWEDIAGLTYAKEQLQEAVVLPSMRPDIYSGLLAPPKGVLLFGPPGTGKTMLAKAVASQGGTRFLGLSASSITSKWVGEGEKRMRAVFTLAEKIQPTVIFIDEIDSLLSARRSGENEASRRLKTEFMVRFEGVSSSPDARVFVLGATNRPWELDDAVLRRFPKRIMIPLPDGPTRRLLLKMCLKGHKHILSDSDFRSIESRTELYSSSDLTHLAKEAAQISVRRLGRRVLDMPKHELPPVGRRDFDDALRAVRPSASRDVLRQVQAWAKDYGTSG